MILARTCRSPNDCSLQLLPMTSFDRRRVDAAVLEELGVLLGPHTSRRALEVARLRAGDDFPDELERVCHGLSGMLRTLLGRQATKNALDQIREHVQGQA